MVRHFWAMLLYWTWDELWRSYLNLYQGSPEILETAWNALVEVRVTTVQRCLFTPFYKCINRYVTKFFGNLFDCHIARYSLISNAMVIYGFNADTNHAKLFNLFWQRMLSTLFRPSEVIFNIKTYFDVLQRLNTS